MINLQFFLRFFCKSGPSSSADSCCSCYDANCLDVYYSNTQLEVITWLLLRMKKVKSGALMSYGCVYGEVLVLLKQCC